MRVEIHGCGTFLETFFSLWEKGLREIVLNYLVQTTIRACISNNFKSSNGSDLRTMCSSVTTIPMSSWIDYFGADMNSTTTRAVPTD